MKRSIIFVAAGITLFISGCDKKGETTTHDHSKHTAGQTEKLIYYTCPMVSHKHIHHREPGKCEECGMKLVEGVVTSEKNKEYYGCPMLIHSHVRSEAPGKCEECGMHLKPMRLKK